MSGSDLIEGTWHRTVLSDLVRERENAVYVELGIRWGDTFRVVAPHARYAHAVDCDANCLRGLAPGIVWPCTTREFFAHWKGTADVFFVDADHELAGVTLDFWQSLGRLRPGGVVALHDALPSTEEALSGDVHLLVEELSRHDDLDVEVRGPWPGLALVRRAEAALPVGD